MKLIIANDSTQLAEQASEFIAETIETNPETAIVPATGSSPMETYQLLASRVRDNEIDTSRLKIFQLDEYLGTTDDDPRSLYGWLVREFLEPLGIPAANVVRLHGTGVEPEQSIQAYQEALAAHGVIDLAILGLGPNGHLGFNEPPSGQDAATRLIDLTPESIVSNARYWGGEDQVPRQALTAGMDVLLGAKQILLLVTGAHKREILDQTLHGEIGPNIPASYLRHHPGAVIIADRAALGHAVQP